MSWKVHLLVHHWYSRWSELLVTSSTVLQTPAGIKKQNDKIKNYFHICKIQKMLNNPNAPKVCYHWWDRVDNSGLQGLQGQRQRGWNWGSSCFLIFLVSYSSHGIIWWVSENNLSLLSSLSSFQIGEMLVPVTAHAAFDKAAELLGMRIRFNNCFSTFQIPTWEEELVVRIR